MNSLAELKREYRRMRKLQGINSFDAGSPRLRVRAYSALGWGIMPTCTGIVVVALGVLLTFTIADGAPPVASPLAECEIQTIDPVNTSAATPGQAYVASRLTADNKVASYYKRGPDGDWVVPRQVDRSDPRVLLLLMAPHKPLVLEVSIFVDGKPFPHHREAWIDDALAIVNQDKKEIGGDNPSATQKGPSTDLTDASPADASAADTSAADTSAADASAVDAEAKETAVRSRVYQRAGSRQRLLQYAALAGGELERDEARWLLAQWTPGPALLMLRPGFAAERAGDMPVLAVLDQDADGRLSIEEVANAYEALRRCDTDEDDMLQTSELVRALGVSSGGDTAWRPSLLLLVLDESTDWHEVRKELKKNYGKVPASLKTATKDRKRDGLSPDVAIRVAFGKREKEVAGLSVNHVCKRISSVSSPPGPTSQTVTMEFDAIRLELSAAQERMTDNIARESGQVAIGAIVDGYPLLSLLDSDADHQLSQREMQAVRSCLARLDRNKDGVLSMKEVPTLIRLVVTKGPHAHRVLCSPRSVVSEGVTKTLQAAPVWFLGMDKNKDGDVSRDEFLGTDEQFQKLDTNADDWISGEEASESRKDAR